MKVFCQSGFESGWVSKTWNDDMTLASCSTHQIIIMKEHFKLLTQDASAMFHIRSHKTSKLFSLPKPCWHFAKKSRNSSIQIIYFARWWFQPIHSNWIISPGIRGENKKYLSCHHPVYFVYVQCPVELNFATDNI